MVNLTTLIVSAVATTVTMVLVLSTKVNDSLLERVYLSFVGTLAGVNTYSLLVYDHPVVPLGSLALCFVLGVAYALFEHRSEIRWHMHLH